MVKGVTTAGQKVEGQKFTFCTTLSHSPRQFDVNVIAEILTISTKDKIALSYVCIRVWTPGEPYWLNDLNYRGKDRKFLFSRVIHVVFHLELSATFVSEYLGFSRGR